MMWTDGSCLDNPGGAGGWAAILREVGQLNVEQVGLGRLKATTNQRAELIAVMKGLQRLEGEGHAVTIFTDSLYTLKVLTGEWEAKLNLDLIRKIKPCLSLQHVRFQHVRGHQGNLLNERVDRLAYFAATQKIPDEWKEMKR